MASKVKFREEDGPAMKHMRAAFLAMKGRPHARVGIMEDGSAEGGGITLAALAAIHEFGAPSAGIPERSFLRSTIDQNKGAYVALCKKLVRGIFDKKLTPEAALNILGARVAADVKLKISTGVGVSPPNAPATIAAKGSDRPLVDTGQLIGALTWSVVMGGGTL